MALYETNSYNSYNSFDERMNNLTQNQILELREAFTTFDKDGNGTICVRELESLMRGLGLKPTETELQELMHEADMNGNGTVDFYEFIAIMLKRPKRADVEDDIIEAFKIFDRDKDGFVTVDDLRAIIKNITTLLDDAVYEDMVREYDVDGDHKLNFEEFQALMTQ